MFIKEKRPPGPTGEALKKVNSHPFYSAETPSLQHLRVAHLTRRHRLAPHMARAVAALAFSEARR